MMIKRIICTALFLTAGYVFAQQNDFIKVKNTQFVKQGKTYNYIGTNYWFGGQIALTAKGKERVIKELDFLKQNGVDNLRILAGAEGGGVINGVTVVGPSLQPKAGEIITDNLLGLDFLLAEMGKRKMEAVIFLSNNWEWSGGFLRYLNWNGLIADSILKRKLGWDEMRDYVAQFYSCDPCMEQYNKQLQTVIGRINTITVKKYVDDVAIMAWEIANEPRPMRPTAIDNYKKFLQTTAANIKGIDKNHLVTIGSEGEMGSENMEVFTAVHADKNVDYTTIHIWPKNWSWFKDTSIGKGFDTVINNTVTYINKHIAIGTQLNKPLVIEEFGLPRDLHIYKPASSTIWRDKYYELIFSKLWLSVQEKGAIAGSNFWSFAGKGRPSAKQLLWVAGDDVIGDPPGEEQGLNTVFDNDKTTWELIKSYTKKIKNYNEAAVVK